jgi:hypothetical protein
MAPFCCVTPAKLEGRSGHKSSSNALSREAAVVSRSTIDSTVCFVRPATSHQRGGHGFMVCAMAGVSGIRRRDLCLERVGEIPTGLNEFQVFSLFKCAVKDDDTLVDAIVEKLYG